MSLFLSSREIGLIGRVTEALVAPLWPSPEAWWHETSRAVLELLGGHHVICVLPGKRLSSELDEGVVQDLAALSRLFNARGTEARRADPLYFRVNTPRVTQPCSVWNRVGTLRHSLEGRRGTSRAFELFRTARMIDSANIDLSQHAGLCVSYEQATDNERSLALVTMLAPAFRAGVRTLSCEAQLEVSDPRLTPRERQIVALVIARRMNHEIARALGISEHTVRHHVESVCAKLEVHSRHEIAGVLQHASSVTRSASRDRQ